MVDLPPLSLDFSSSPSRPSVACVVVSLREKIVVVALRENAAEYFPIAPTGLLVTTPPTRAPNSTQTTLHTYIRSHASDSREQVRHAIPTPDRGCER